MILFLMLQSYEVSSKRPNLSFIFSKIIQHHEDNNSL
jgi:hypothetical protein